MDPICIRKYRPEDHEAVNRIFSDGIRGQVTNGICQNLIKPHIFALYIIFPFLFLGSIYSFYNGLIGVLFGLGIYSLSVYLSFMGYVW